MTELGIDIETYSSFELTECGVYRYVEAEDFTVLLFGYSADGAPAECVDLASGEELPGEILSALTDPSVTKTAYNAMFERVCLSKYLGVKLDVRQWRCTMVRAARLGFPLSLAQCAKVLGLEQQKMTEGQALIRLFSMPRKARKTDTLFGSESRRVPPQEHPEKWETFKEYNRRDVDVEQAVLAKVRRLPVPDFDDRLYETDQAINDRGVLLDRTLAENADRFYHTYREELMAKLKGLTGLDNPNSPTQVKEWIRKTTGINVDSLNKKDIDSLIGSIPSKKVKEALTIRKELAKTSCAKYEAMLQCVCSDGRIRGLFQFYGAARTGRWAGRLVQMQNLPQNHLKDIGTARDAVVFGDYDEFCLEYSQPTYVLSELIRTAFIAKEGCTFHVCDFSAIEARVVAWLAGEEWVLDVFRKGGDVYCATASQMFGVPVEKHGANSELRQKGKIAVLALGYGGGVMALDAMGGQRLGLSEEEEREIVWKWRDANAKIVKLWGIVEKCAIAAIRGESKEPIVCNRGLRFSFWKGCLLITLPSGRPICYPRAKVGVEYTRKGEKDSIEYEGVDQSTKSWCTIRTFGGKLVENIVQAVARDILGWVLLRAEEKGYRTVFHVHDEIIVEAGEGQRLEDVEALFSEPIPWAKGLPLKGAGYSTPYYLKD